MVRNQNLIKLGIKFNRMLTLKRNNNKQKFNLKLYQKERNNKRTKDHVIYQPINENKIASEVKQKFKVALIDLISYRIWNCMSCL